MTFFAFPPFSKSFERWGVRNGHESLGGGEVLGYEVCQEPWRGDW